VASDTSLVFNLLGKDRISPVLAAIKNAFRSAGDTAEAAMDEASKSVEKLQNQVAKAEEKLEQLDAAATKAAFAQEAAGLRLSSAQDRYNQLIQKGTALQDAKAEAAKRVEAAEQAVADTAEKSEKEQQAAQNELTKAKTAYNRLLATENSLEGQKSQALNRVNAAELAVAMAADRETRISADRSKVVSALEGHRSALRDLGDAQDGETSKFSAFISVMGTSISTIGNVGSAIGTFGSTAGSLISSLWGLVTVIAEVAAALSALGPAVALAGGALGSLPGLLSGGIAAIGTLKLGLGGLSSEYQRLTTKTGGGGGGATKAQKDFTAATRAVQQATEELSRSERDVTTAQREALQAQQAVTAAREAASKRIRDEALDLEGAQLDQKDATDAVTQAQNDLNVAIATKNSGEIDKAQEALQRAQIAAEQAKNKVDDLTEANKTNAKTGVEGSDEVVQAKQREADARQRVADAIQAEKDAQQRLADSQKALADQKKQGSAGGGGGGGAGQQITQLAPAAREFLNTILKLRPAFTNLRLDVQQHLFAGLAGPIQGLAQKWLPQLHKTLDQFAGTFNGIAKQAIGTAGKKTFIDDMAKGADGVRQAIGDVGKALAGPFLDAWGKLSRASVPFLTTIGRLLAGTITKFSTWISSADKSGKLTAFFKGAADTLGKVWSLGTKIVGIIGQFIGIIYGQAKSGGDNVLDAANNALTAISTWLANPKNQAYIRGVVDEIMKWVGGLGAFIKSLNGAKGTAHGVFDFIIFMIHASTTAVKIFAAMWGAAVTTITHVMGWVDKFAQKVQGLPGRIRNGLLTMWDGLKDGFRSAINWVIGRLNGLHFTIPSVSILGQTFGGGTIGFQNIPYLAKGGDITRGGAAVVGDAGPEVVSLPRGARVTPLKQAGGATVVTFDFKNVNSDFARALVKMIRTSAATRQELATYLKAG
jgi:hypothetical protein